MATSKKVSKKKTVTRRSGTGKKVTARSASTAKTTAPAATEKSEASGVRQTQHEQPSYGANSGTKYALGASLLALVLSVYAVYETTLKTSKNSVHLSGVEDRVNTISTGQQGFILGFESQKTRTEEELNRIDAGLNGVESSVAKLELLAQASIDDIKANLGESVARWKLDEVHSLLTRVNRIYQLTGEQAKAIAGLELAQASLATIDNPRLAAVNSALAEDILRVKADRYIDIAALNDRLVGITKVIPKLVLLADVREEEIEADADAQAGNPEQVEDAGFLAAGKTLFSDIGNLVKHKNLDAPLQPSLDEHGRFVVYEVLRLQVHAAMVALLRRDNASYQSQLALAAGSLNTYFDSDEATTKVILDQLQVLQSFDISLNVKAISRALNELNRVMVLEN